MPTLNGSLIEALWEKEKLLETSILSFSHIIFSTLPKANFNSSAYFKLSSANALNLEQSKTLSFGTELTHDQIVPTLWIRL